MLNKDYLKGYMSGIISATDTNFRAVELCNNVLDVALHFDCKPEDVLAAKEYAEHLINLFYAD